MNRRLGKALDMDGSRPTSATEATSDAVPSAEPGRSVDRVVARRLDAGQRLLESVDTLPVRSFWPTEPSLWVSPSQHDANNLRAAQQGGPLSQELTASFRFTNQQIVSRYCVHMDDDGSSLVVEPLSSSRGDMYRNARGVHHLLVSLAQRAGARTLWYLDGDERVSFFELEQQVGTAERVGIVRKSCAIRLEPIPGRGIENARVQCIAIDDVSHDAIGVVFPAALAASVTAYERAVTAASLALDANAQMKFERPIDFVDLTYRPTKTQPYNTFATVLDLLVDDKWQRGLKIGEGFIHDQTRPIHELFFNDYVAKGHFLPAEDAMYVAAAHAVVDAAIGDVGRRVRPAERCKTGTLFGSLAAVSALAGLSGVFDAPASVVGTAGMLGALCFGVTRDLCYHGTRQTVKAIGLPSRRFRDVQLRAGLDVAERERSAITARRLLTAAFLRDDVAKELEPHIDSVMKPLNTGDSARSSKSK